jgi:hypothetical protein
LLFYYEEQRLSLWRRKEIVVTIKQTQKSDPDFYELALLLAYGQSGRCKNGQHFIDNLSRICDQFAWAVSVKERRYLAYRGERLIARALRQS